MSVYAIALSGLNAQSNAVHTHAKNIANLHTTGKTNPGQYDRTAYAPRDSVLISTAGGGVAQREIPVEPSSVKIYQPDHPDSDADGMIAAPNLSLDRELIGIQTAKHAYTANAKLIGVQREMDDALLDILS